MNNGRSHTNAGPSLQTHILPRERQLQATDFEVLER